MKGLVYVCAAFFGLVLSFFGLVLAGSGGTGSLNSIGMALLLAYAVCWSLAAVMAKRGNVSIAAIALFSPLFVVWIVGSIFMTLSGIDSMFAKDPPEFTAACKATGEWFYSKPTEPAHSIAYDWTVPHGPQYGFYTVGFNGRILRRGGEGRLPRFYQAMQFVERKNDGGGYQRWPKQSPAVVPDVVSIQALTADIVVDYRISPAIVSAASGPATYELTVTDRRDGKKLAAMRYVVYRQRICGPIEHGVLSETDFLVKALGLP